MSTEKLKSVREKEQDGFTIRISSNLPSDKAIKSFNKELSKLSLGRKSQGNIDVMKSIFSAA